MDAALLEFLARPESYPERPRCVERIDTHISIVFLTDHFAYKLRKPVKFDFLDFSSPERRRADCQEELRVNRRLAADVYLDVVGVARDPHRRFRWANSSDEPCEWLVKMRRLPDDVRLDRRLAAGSLDATEFSRLADTLLEFYRRLPAAPVSADDYVRQLRQHLSGNEQVLSRAAPHLPAPLVTRIHRAQLRQLQLWPDHWRGRVDDGRIVDGHGDLRPEHIYLLPRPVVIDAIEFNAEFRQVDVLDDLGFLSVECEMLGDERIGQALIDRYCEQAHDRPPRGVLEFYRSYRACVRSKVAVLRAQQESNSCESDARESYALATRYLQLADKVLHGLARQIVIVVRGRSGTGKSTIARQLASVLAAELLQTDVLRRELARHATPAGDAPSPSDANAFGTGRYSHAQRLAVYETMIRQAGKRLSDGESVVLDGTFLAANPRRQTAQLAAEHHALMLEIHCHCADDIARQRVTSRLAAGHDASEIRPELLADQSRQEEPCEACWPTVSINTGGDVDSSMREVLSAVRRLFDDETNGRNP